MIDTKAIKEAAKEKWNELLQSLIREHAAKKKKNASGKIVKYSAVEKNPKHTSPKLKKKKTISVTECSTSEKKKKGKRPAIEMDSDSDFVTKKKVKKEKVKWEDEGLIKEVKNNERKSINIRMSPRSLKKVLEKLRIPQVEELEKMGFGEFHNNFNFYSTPSELGLWVVTNFE
ncbi:hypothetical protein CTI12_AA379270 [Artemisia annua]|uniref:Uncharacterized protein n=1 Tax=Artemisia annua TaxID=35608 RepID=A0A2U1MHR6_ARTAN|nr:hypothetical protein CTI12_AA379270 [Artemisia annua]